MILSLIQFRNINNNAVVDFEYRSVCRSNINKRYTVFFFSFFLLIVIAHTCSTVLYPVTNFAGFDYLSLVLSIVASGAQICVLPHAPEIHLVTVSKN